MLKAVGPDPGGETWPFASEDSCSGKGGVRGSDREGGGRSRSGGDRAVGRGQAGLSFCISKRKC